MSQVEQQKKQAAEQAIEFIKPGMIVGVGTGSTVKYFIDALANIKHKIEGCVSSSVTTENLLKKQGIPLLELNSVNELALYVDGADEIDPHRQMIKGGGGALTREKIIASVAETFICIVHAEKQVKLLGQFPVAVEVIPMARSYVARQIVKLGGRPEYRLGYVTDNSNVILDVYDLDLTDAVSTENKLNQIPGVIENGVFASRLADEVVVGK